MGGNGSFALGTTHSEAGRRWKTIMVTPSGIKVLELKNTKDSISLPEESHTPNSIYAVFNKDLKELPNMVTMERNCSKYIPQITKVSGLIIILGKMAILWMLNL